MRENDLVRMDAGLAVVAEVPPDSRVVDEVLVISYVDDRNVECCHTGQACGKDHSRPGVEDLAAILRTAGPDLRGKVFGAEVGGHPSSTTGQNGRCPLYALSRLDPEHEFSGRAPGCDLTN